MAIFLVALSVQIGANGAVYRQWLADPTLNEAAIDRRLAHQGLRYLWNHTREVPDTVIWRFRRTFDLWPARRSAMHEVGEGAEPDGADRYSTEFPANPASALSCLR